MPGAGLLGSQGPSSVLTWLVMCVQSLPCAGDLNRPLVSPLTAPAWWEGGAFM